MGTPVASKLEHLQYAFSLGHIMSCWGTNLPVLFFAVQTSPFLSLSSSLYCLEHISLSWDQSSSLLCCSFLSCLSLCFLKLALGCRAWQARRSASPFLAGLQYVYCLEHITLLGDSFLFFPLLSFPFPCIKLAVGCRALQARRNPIPQVLAGLQYVYCLEHISLSGDEVFLFKCHPGDWQVSPLL